MKKGFTLLEMTIVIVIIGILAMIALPEYFKIVERGRAYEGFQLLGALRNAQLHYAAENSAGTTTGNLADLDMEFTSAKFFGLPQPNAGVNPVAERNGNLGSIARTGGYTFSIEADGDITCAAGGNIACPPIPR